VAATRTRKILKVLLIALLVLAVVPPVQVLLTGFWNPKTSPMQWQRWVESWGNKEPGWAETPIKWMTLKEIPQAQIHYIWASEDQNFFEHGGFDIPQLRKAMKEAKVKGRDVRGASTITMQCARSVYLWQGRSYVRKVLEAYYTFWMELFLSKQRILELYLNHIELGPGIYGVGAAAEKHFGKPLNQLSKSQMMALAAILPNPQKWSPVNPQGIVQSKIRRVERLSRKAPFPAKELAGATK
jgi:monofunctional biosynthetic peptidoglycan transglycosylase